MEIWILRAFCVLIFAQGIWKKPYKDRLLKEVKEDFLGKAYWDPMYDVPIYFFDPIVKNEENEACELCHALYPLFRETLASNEGFIRFSHRTLWLQDIDDFITKILTDNNIKKVFLLLLDQDSYTIKTKLRITQILNQIKSKKIKKSEFLGLIEKDQLEFSVFYEIIKDRYF